MAMATNKYVLIKTGARVQFSLSHTVAISLLISKTTPMTMMGITAAAKILTSPATLYQMATADMVNPLSNASGYSVPVMTWPNGSGYCRRVYIQTIAYNTERAMHRTACFDNTNTKWRWVRE